ncbi:hypothetical protein PsYK624_059380 [Phanerochaete sordida]|uniref:Protein kinase domain-containing protein n=1 Tax=Phanerochaete sordida TaxID=48140 RepID=A0A9P3LCQ9_9APHY|nr:hypothetical protein PsYK624_059380 [Phanerochaete sordida]
MPSSGSSYIEGGGVNYMANSTRSTADIRKVLGADLANKQTTSRNLLRHYLRFESRAPEEDAWLVDCQHRLRSSQKVSESLQALQDIHEQFLNTGVRAERDMYDPLETIFDEVGSGANRKFHNTHSSSVAPEDTFPTFAPVKPDFILRQHSTNVTPTSKVLWRVILSCVEVKCSHKDGPNQKDDSVRTGTVKEIVSQAGDYSRIHLAHRPFQLFSISLLIYGPYFNVSVYDRGGVIHSPSMLMYTDKRVVTPEFIFVLRRMLHDLTPTELGRELLVGLHSGDESDTTGNHYPCFEVSGQPMKDLSAIKGPWLTVGRPIWTSYSLVGRGTTVWKVKAGTSGLKTFIMKSAWRHSDRRTESFIYGYMKTKGLLGLRGIADFLAGQDVSFDRNGQSTSLTVNALRPVDAFLEEDIVLHRVLLTSVGKPLWEFDDPEHLIRALIAVVTGIKALATYGILHRDLSIGNVLLSVDRRDGYEAFLTDFEFASIAAIVDENNPVTIVQVPGEKKRAPKTATNTHTRWTVKRGPQMTGTLQFMAIDILRNVAAFYDDLQAAQLVEHEVKHDLESLIWVADYALYRRAFERVKDLPQKDEGRVGVETALKTDYGQLNVRSIRNARRNAYTAARRGRSELQTERVWPVLQAVEPALTDIRTALLMMVADQDVASVEEAGMDPFKLGFMIKKHKPEMAMQTGTPITTDVFEGFLHSCLDMYCGVS